jgi:two-component system cell cycle response regulator CtrA
MLPDMDGYEVLKRLRASKVETPILILSGLSETGQQDQGSGLRRRRLPDQAVRQARTDRPDSGDRPPQPGPFAERDRRPASVKVNLDTRTVEVDSKPLHLTGKEYGILELLSLRKGTTLTKEMFLNHLYGGMDEPEVKIIDVFICKLRKKLQNADRRRQLHRNRLGPRLCPARSGRGKGCHRPDR